MGRFYLSLICKFSKEIYVIENNQLGVVCVINKKVISLANKANKIIKVSELIQKLNHLEKSTGIDEYQMNECIINVYGRLSQLNDQVINQVLDLIKENFIFNDQIFNQIMNTITTSEKVEYENRPIFKVFGSTYLIDSILSFIDASVAVNLAFVSSFFSRSISDSALSIGLVYKIGQKTDMELDKVGEYKGNRFDLQVIDELRFVATTFKNLTKLAIHGNRSLFNQSEIAKQTLKSMILESQNLEELKMCDVNFSFKDLLDLENLQVLNLKEVTFFDCDGLDKKIFPNLTNVKFKFYSINRHFFKIIERSPNIERLKLEFLDSYERLTTINDDSNTSLDKLVYLEIFRADIDTALINHLSRFFSKAHYINLEVLSFNRFSGSGYDSAFKEIIQKFPNVKNINITFRVHTKEVFQLSDEVLQIASEKNIECAVYA